MLSFFCGFHIGKNQDKEEILALPNPTDSLNVSEEAKQLFARIKQKKNNGGGLDHNELSAILRYMRPLIAIAEETRIENAEARAKIIPAKKV